MNNFDYQEKFVSWPIIGFVILIDLLMFLTLKDSLGFFVFLFLSLVVLVNTFSFKLEIEGTTVYYLYGLGFVGSSIPAAIIDSYDVKDLNSLQAWLYNPSGTQSLVIRLKNNQDLYFPTRDPKRVIRYLQSKI